MNPLLEIAARHALEIFIGIMLALGLPVLINFLRKDAKKKLTDKDPKNDVAGQIQESLADVLDMNKDKFGKQLGRVKDINKKTDKDVE